MGRITFTAEQQHEDIIEDAKDDIDTESTAGAVRACIERAATLQQREADLQQRIDNLERENERLRNEKRALIDAREEHAALVEYVEEEWSLQQRREIRQQANVLQRAWWWLAGTPPDDNNKD